MIIAVFGSTLAIVSMFAIWYLQNKNLSVDRQEYIGKIKSFIFLYTLIILTSMFGIIIGIVPPLNASEYEITSISEGLSIIIFEFTLLLIIPALACLYELIDWIMNLKQEDDPLLIQLIEFNNKLKSFEDILDKTKRN